VTNKLLYEYEISAYVEGHTKPWRLCIIAFGRYEMLAKMFQMAETRKIKIIDWVVTNQTISPITFELAKEEKSPEYYM